MMRVEKAFSFRELCFVLYVFVKRIERDERGGKWLKLKLVLEAPA